MRLGVCVGVYESVRECCLGQIKVETGRQLVAIEHVRDQSGSETHTQLKSKMGDENQQTISRVAVAMSPKDKIHN